MKDGRRRAKGKSRSKPPIRRASVRFLDDKDELAVRCLDELVEKQSDIVKAEVERLERRALTADERRVLKDKWEAVLELFRRKCETAQGDELDNCLRGALVMCVGRPPPDWLRTSLIERLGRPLTKDERRHRACCIVRDEEGAPWRTTRTYGKRDEPGLLTDYKPGVFDIVSEGLRGEDAGTPRTMREAYDKIEAELRSKGRGRPRTYRPPRKK